MGMAVVVLCYFTRQRQVDLTLLGASSWRARVQWWCNAWPGCVTRLLLFTRDKKTRERLASHDPSRARLSPISARPGYARKSHTLYIEGSKILAQAVVHREKWLNISWYSSFNECEPKCFQTSLNKAPSIAQTASTASDVISTIERWKTNVNRMIFLVV